MAVTQVLVRRTMATVISSVGRYRLHNEHVTVLSATSWRLMVQRVKQVSTIIILTC